MQKSMKARIIIISLLGLTVIIFSLFMLWPLSLADVLSEDTEIRVLVIDLNLSDNKPRMENEEFTIQHDSDEYVQIKQILSKYSFRRSFKSLTGNSRLDGNSAGYWIQIYQEGKGIITGGTREIGVNGRVHRIVYWGNAKNIAMMGEIREVLTNIVINSTPNASDSIRFAAEYMELNGELRSNGEPHYVLDIPEDVPVIYLEADEVIKKLESGTGMINLGFPICPWCREIVPYLIYLTRQNNIPLYYMNIQPIRDVQELDESGEVITVTEGTPDYHRMVELLYDWLWEYRGLDDPSIKRIYVPTTIFVKEGEIQYVHIATLRENYDDGYIPLDDSQSERVANYLNNAVMQLSGNRTDVDAGCDECP